ncbi:MAG TPA: triphosphoribosyl-dephospho-CoA synthase CitG [Spirochaetia bacterium]|nr:triphosphoribosyl-dephospho-CoA synthase CitG [Spirochaetia bacterium]
MMIAAGSASRTAAAFGIAAAATDALIAEVDITPKPGLVDRVSSGAHRDMDHALFCASAAAIAPFFEMFAEAGTEHGSSSPSALFPRLQAIGREAEAAMFSATGGVNTHKGLIFSLGIASAAAGISVSAGMPTSPESVCQIAAEVSAGVVRRHYAHSLSPDEETYGERIYRLYGISGVRGEAEGGFPHVLRCALPVLRKCSSREQRVRDEVGVAALLELMSVVPDTNVLGRNGPAALALVQRESRIALELGGMFTREGRNFLREMDLRLVARNISPGGSADLLAVALFLHNIAR